MSAKFFISLLLMFPLFLGTEIIQFSKLKKREGQFKIKRNIFSPDSIVANNSFSKSLKNPSPEAIKTEIEKNLSKKMAQVIFFEGYIIKNNKSFALLSINGEFFVSGEGDVVGDNIKVSKIGKKKVVLKVDSKFIEIFLKGDNND